MGINKETIEILLPKMFQERETVEENIDSIFDNQSDTAEQLIDTNEDSVLEHMIIGNSIGNMLILPEAFQPVEEVIKIAERNNNVHSSTLIKGSKTKPKRDITEITPTIVAQTTLGIPIEDPNKRKRIPNKRYENNN
jgi:hypothetical protein